jgi:hypothetical protein
LAEERCNLFPSGSTIACYYDEQDPKDTLTLSSSQVLVGGIASIIVFTILSFFGITASVITMLWNAHLYDITKVSRTME